MVWLNSTSNESLGTLCVVTGVVYLPLDDVTRPFSVEARLIAWSF